MCEPATIAIAAGGAKAVGGVMQAKAKHDAARNAAKRQNEINRRNYENQLAQRAHADKMKGKSFSRKLAAYAAAQSAAARQKEMNQMEATRASIAAQQALKEKHTESAFESQAALIKSIQSQGTVLASGQASGQSMLLTMMNEERALGFQEAQLNASMNDARTSYGITQAGINLDQYGAEIAAMSRLPGAPTAESASFDPVKMPKVKGPSGMGLLGGVISAVGGGISTGLEAGNAMHKAQGGTGGWLKD